jgi:hypothetical protein
VFIRLAPGYRRRYPSKTQAVLSLEEESREVCAWFWSRAWSPALERSLFAF